MFSVIKRSISCILCLAFLSGCGSSSEGDNPEPDNSSSADGQSSSESSSANSSASEQSNSSTSAPAEQSRIQVNQLGFFPQAQKLAVVPETDAQTFSVVSTQSGETVFTGDLSVAFEWSPAGEPVSVADFSGWVEPGDYLVRVEGAVDSYPFEIGNDVYASLNDAALKAYYFNRASTELLEEHAGEYARPLGHEDENVLVHESAADGSRSENDSIEAPRGWYDAGDFGKYVVNSGISTYTLLAAYDPRLLRRSGCEYSRKWRPVAGYSG